MERLGGLVLPGDVEGNPRPWDHEFRVVPDTTELVLLAEVAVDRVEVDGTFREEEPVGHAPRDNKSLRGFHGKRDHGDQAFRGRPFPEIAQTNGAFSFKDDKIVVMKRMDVDAPERAGLGEAGVQLDRHDGQLPFVPKEFHEPAAGIPVRGERDEPDACRQEHD